MSDTALTFGDVIETVEALIALMPTGIQAKEDILRAMQSRLRFPDYFGGNWDALDECLRDLSWVKQRRVVLIHRDLPQLESNDLNTYLTLLASVVRNWIPGEAHELVVCFPGFARRLDELIDPKEPFVLIDDEMIRAELLAIAPRPSPSVMASITARRRPPIRLSARLNVSAPPAQHLW